MTLKKFNMNGVGIIRRCSCSGKNINVNCKLLRVLVLAIFTTSFGNSFTFTIRNDKKLSSTRSVCQRSKTTKQEFHPSTNNHRHISIIRTSCCFPLSSKRDDEPDISDILNDGNEEFIIRGDENDILEASEWNEFETGKPSELAVMKEVRKIFEKI